MILTGLSLLASCLVLGYGLLFVESNHRFARTSDHLGKLCGAGAVIGGGLIVFGIVHQIVGML